MSKHNLEIQISASPLNHLHQSVGQLVPQILPLCQHKILIPKTLLVAPTAASAAGPSVCPTIAASATLYVCWNRFPNKSGIANCNISFKGFPSTILFLIVSFLPSKNIVYYISILLKKKSRF